MHKHLTKRARWWMYTPKWSPTPSSCSCKPSWPPITRTSMGAPRPAQSRQAQVRGPSHQGDTWASSRTKSPRWYLSNATTPCRWTPDCSARRPAPVGPGLRWDRPGPAQPGNRPVFLVFWMRTLEARDGPGRVGPFRRVEASEALATLVNVKQNPGGPGSQTVAL